MFKIAPNNPDCNLTLKKSYEDVQVYCITHSRILGVWAENQITITRAECNPGEVVALEK